MTQSYTTRLNAILRNSVTPLVASEGFTHGGNIYTRYLDNHQPIWMVEVQRGRWSNNEKVDFTLNCGVLIPGLIPIYTNRPESRQYTLTDCCIYTRVGMLHPDRLDKWWSLTSNDVATADNDISNDLDQRIREGVMPFLRRFPSFQDAMLFLAGQQTNSSRHRMTRLRSVTQR